MWGPQVTEEVLRETFGTLGCNGDVQQETRDVVGWCRLRAIFICFFLSELSEEVFPTCSWSISCGSLNFILLQLLMHLTVQTILAQSEEPRYSSNSSLVFPCVSCAVSHFYVFEKWQTGLQNQDKSRSFGLPGHSNLAEVMRCHREGLGTWGPCRTLLPWTWTRSEP